MRLSSEAIKASSCIALAFGSSENRERREGSTRAGGERGCRRTQGLGAEMGDATVTQGCLAYTLSASRQAGAQINGVLGRNGQGVHGAPRA
jgi:osmotically-inducible protein OsmY